MSAAAASKRRHGPIAPTRRMVLLGAGALVASGPACAQTGAIKGIDVSADNGPVDWADAARSGAEFAYVRATLGAHTVDERFSENAAGAKAAGLKLGAYHVHVPGRSGVDQAANFLGSVKDARLDLAAMIDVEGLSADEAADAVKAIRSWLAAVEARYGAAKAGVYLSANTWDLLGRPELGRRPLWLAQWGAATPETPPGWAGPLALWQHSDQGRIKGVDGPVDLDRILDLDALTL